MATDKSTKKTSTKSTPEICNICANNYTPILRKKIICKFCSKDTCSKCVEQYLMGRMEDAHCIHCRVKYTDSMLYEICTKTYLQQTYFRHRQEILVNRERANLPGLQIAALERRQRRDNYKLLSDIKKHIKELNDKRSELRHQYNQIYIVYFEKLRNKEDTHIDRTKLDAISEDENKLHREIMALKEQLFTIRWGERVQPENTDEKKDDEKKDDEKKKFIRRCMKPNCQGFLSTAWKCGLCNWYSCSKCFTLKGEDHDSPHECKKEDLDTANLIRADSKPCPSCGEFINKSVGCDQMFCVSCKTPFSWNSGKMITTGHIHNPHYFEWLQRTGGQIPRNPADVPCGGFPMAWELRRLDHLGALKHSYQEFYRICMEIQDVSQRQYRSHLDEATTHDINIRFLLNDFDEKLWGRHLAMNEKKKKRDFEIQEIFGAFRMIAVELINRVQQYRHPVSNNNIDNVSISFAEEVVKDVLIQVDELIKMINDSFKRLSISYHYSVPYISKDGDGVRRFRYRLLSKNFSDEVKKKIVKKNKKEDVVEEKKDTVEYEDLSDDELDSEEEEEDKEEEVDTVIENRIDPEIVAPNEFQDMNLQRALEESFKDSQLRKY